MADLIEDSFSKMGLSENEKNKRVKKLANYVNRVAPAKRK